MAGERLSRALRVIDLYCERLGPGLLAEPLNACSNGFFFLAAWVAACEARRARAAHLTILALLVALIGIGSTLFHVFASSWAEWADVLPIGLFQLCYLGTYLRKAAGCGRLATAIALALFTAGVGLAASLPPWFNGSLAYIPALLALYVLGLHSWRRTGSLLLLSSGTLFLLSLAARSIDLRLCGIWPYGTHFIWHTLNAAVLLGAVRALPLSVGQHRR